SRRPAAARSACSMTWSGPRPAATGDCPPGSADFPRGPTSEHRTHFVRGRPMNDRSRWIALVVLCTGMLMIVLDMTIVNVALPTIQADLGFSQAGLAWVVNAYLIAFAGLLLLVGLLAGGLLTQVLNWHWIFFVNLPVGVITAIAARRTIARDRGAGLRAGADVPGALLITGAMMLAVYTIVGPAGQRGWLAGETLGLGAGTLVLLAGFIVRQKTARHPLMPLRIFASRNVTGSNLVQVLGTAGMFGMFFLGSLYLRQIMGYDPLQIGLAFLPVAVVMGVLSVRYTDRLVMRFGARTLLFPGLGLIAAGLGLFALAPAHGGSFLVHVFPVTVLMGTGAGLCFPALMTLAMSSATPQDAG